MAVSRGNDPENGNDGEIAANFLDEILTNKKRFRILQLLFVYGELSLTALSKHMHKSKPALYHHLQKMINMGVVKVSREAQIRGSIMAKYYCLDEKVALKIQLISEENLIQTENPEKRLKLFKDVIEAYKNTVSLFRNKIDMLDLYTEFLEEEIEAAEDSVHIDSDLQNLISNYEIGYHAQYLTEEQYRKFLDYYQEFYTKVRNMIVSNESDEKIVERPYFTITVMMPLKKLLELELERMRRK